MSSSIDLSTPAAGSGHDADNLLQELKAGFVETADEVVPWFVEHMPGVYFQDTDRASQLSHLRAIIAAKASGRPIELTLRNEGGSEWTSMRPQDSPGILAAAVAELPYDRHLRSAKIHTATDGSLVINTFEFGEAEPFDPADPAQKAKLEATIEFAAKHDPAFTADEVREHFHRCTAEYILTLTPLRLCEQFALFRRLTGTDGTEVLLEQESDKALCRIVVAVGNSSTRRMLERIATRLAKAEINVHRAYLDLINDGPHASITLLGFVVEAPDGGPIDEDSPFWREVRRDLERIKWLDHRTLDLAYRHAELGMVRAEVIAALCDLTHHKLVKVNSYAYSAENIYRFVHRNPAQAAAIADLFLARFDPREPLDDAAFAGRADALAERIGNEVDLEEARTVLRKLLEAVRAVLRTNFFVRGRYGFGVRIDPTFLATNERAELPYGVFFVHGRGFNGFHVRFRDIARGGLRVVRTRSEEQHALEAERLYDEAYGLSFAQQLKNKDIPEGGAKAAVLLDPYAKLDRCVKGFVDALLDLVTPDEAVRRDVVDYYGQEELLYLGPDENITPDLILWIVNRAQQRRYPLPTALMSSKPGAGINHKEYGVTSEGVTVFLDVGLRALGIHPDRDPFTLKMTGGPDGDVGGNLIKILRREYGDNGRIVGIADGSGCGEDPDGLDLDELLRLVDTEAPIASFDRSKLGPNGRIVALDEPDGVHLRNTLHMRVEAQAFVPCGGRPNAIHGRNWQDYLNAEGKPSSRIIVEGANLFLTPEARRSLSEHGVLIFKDSSANKCGVITSSFEIISNMLLSETEFLEIKDRFVPEVLDRLRSLARREAELLVRGHRSHPNVPLPEMSTRISRVMIATADAIEQAVDRFERLDRDLLRGLVHDHLPPVLLETAGRNIWNVLPRPYVRWIMAKTLAARIVYREGVDYMESMPEHAIADLAFEYLRVEREREKLAHVIDESELPDRERVAAILRQAGILAAFGSE